MTAIYLDLFLNVQAASVQSPISRVIVDCLRDLAEGPCELYNFWSF